MLDAIKQRSSANERKMDALLDRLGQRAHLSDQQKGEVALKMLESPEFQAAAEEGMSLVRKMMKGLDIVLSSKDATRNCHAVIDMMAILPEVDANAERQWRIMREIVEAEAKRLNVSLAD